jgi:hypothetical protein
MLAATTWTHWSVDLIYTDSIDYEDAMQACIQNIKNPSMQRHFEEVIAARADDHPANKNCSNGNE